jgi:uncharacterized ferritin-like protein (DUF455 family)
LGDLGGLKPQASALRHAGHNLGMQASDSPRLTALAVLRESDPARKVLAALSLWSACASLASASAIDTPDWVHADLSAVAASGALLPGRPERPVLVSATAVPSRSPFTTDGRAALLHAICHIEFNAINLACDAVWRFAGMPLPYYTDWLRVAAEEASHFKLLREHLQGMGLDYGDFPAHDGLWNMCAKTAHDIVARMALVPRTLEARGLDATPLIQDKLRRAGDLRAVEILDTILRDEVGHVAIGNRWYHHLCQQHGLNALTLYPELVKRFEAPRMRPPFNEAARRAAGFTDEEMAYLAGEG